MEQRFKNPPESKAKHDASPLSSSIDQASVAVPGLPLPEIRSARPPEVAINLVDDVDQAQSPAGRAGAGGGGAGGGGGGDNSPESGSLYSDEIPSGYNSGEQYDTLSTGYMSGEAYELPDTRMDIREPALDVIEECLQPLGGLSDAANSDDNIFVLPTSSATTAPIIGGVEMEKEMDQCPMMSSSSSEGGLNNDDAATFRNVQVDFSIGPPAAGAQGGVPKSPTFGGAVKSKLRKATFAINIDATPLQNSDDYRDDPESSDAAFPASVSRPGYRTVPSDTDTSAFDSDANAIGRLHASDSGAELLHHSTRNSGKAGRMANRKAKAKCRRDEEWFDAHDSKYWSWVRNICFWGAIGSMLGSIVAAGIMLYLMPRNCDPPHEWYQGTVMMDIKPSWSAEDGKYQLNLPELHSRLADMKANGIQTVHLKDLTKIQTGPEEGIPNPSYHPTENNFKVYPSVFRSERYNRTIVDFINATHQYNMTVMVHLPVVTSEGKGRDGGKGILSLDLEHSVAKTIEFWARQGADGFFLDGLEGFGDDNWVAESVANWNLIFDKFGTTPNKHVLMTSYLFAHSLQQHDNQAGDKALSHIGLLDATIDMEYSNFSELSERIDEIAVWDSLDSRPWINWNLKFVRRLPLTHAALAFQLLLPGTINIEDPSSYQGSSQGITNHSLLADATTLNNLTRLRTLAVPIHMNGNYKRCNCEEKLTKEPNLILKEPLQDIIQLERFYSRRNRYILVANFGDDSATLDTVGRSYSRGELMVDTSQRQEVNKDIVLKQASLQPGHAFVIKLPK